MTRRGRKKLCAASLVVGFTSAMAAAHSADASTVRYVDDDAAVGGDGAGWSTAFRFLGDALMLAAVPENGVTEIRVAQGRYTPDQVESNPTGTGDQEATFLLVNGVTLSGGYAGLWAPDPDLRDPLLHETVLSGDLLGNDNPTFDATHAENSYTVVTGSGTDSSAVLDGFTISGGTAAAPAGGRTSWRNGGGILNIAGSPSVIDCAIVGNYARTSGGGMYNQSGSNPVVSGCVIAGNLAQNRHGGGMFNDTDSSPTVTATTFSGNATANGRGGGLHNAGGSSPSVLDCAFSENTARQSGGGMSNVEGSSPTVVRCTFRSNSTTAMDTNGGGMDNNGGCSPMLVNCLFAGNDAEHNGGALGNVNGCNAVVVNCAFIANSSADRGGGVRAGFGCSLVLVGCTFAGNSSGEGGAFSAGSQNAGATGHSLLANSILWDNTAPIGPQIALVGNFPADLTVAYSDVEGGRTAVEVQAGFTLTWSGGNIDADPLFADPDGPDDDPATWQDNDYRLGAGSPCIDAGDNTAVPADSQDLDGDADTAEPTPLDLGLVPRFVDDLCRSDVGNPGPPGPIVDMGGYERQSSTCDLDGDGRVGVTDLLILLGAWGSCPGPCPPFCAADFDNDCDVGVTDLLALLGAW